jgi:hypothetical protein
MDQHDIVAMNEDDSPPQVEQDASKAWGNSLADFGYLQDESAEGRLLGS